MTPADGGLRVEDPAPVPTIVALLGQQLRGSALRGVDVELELELAHASVVAAFVDGHRRAVLRALAGRRDADVIAFDRAEIRRAATEPAVELQWITGVLAADHGVQPPAAADADVALEVLVEAGHVARDGERLALAGPLREMAERMLVAGKLLRVTAGHEADDGTIARARFTCVQFGALDLLVLERVADRIRIATASASTVLDYVGAFLTRDDLLGTPSDAAPAAAAPMHEGAWSPTHVVPNTGLATWAACDPAAERTAPLGPRLPVRVDERRGDWAHVSCSNGWTAWVDGRALETIAP